MRLPVVGASFAAVGVVAATGVGVGVSELNHADTAHPVETVVYGTLGLDAAHHCSWVTNPRGTVQVTWPTDVRVDYAAGTVTTRAGRTFRVGDRVASAYDTQTATAPGCDSPAPTKGAYVLNSSDTR